MNYLKLSTIYIEYLKASFLPRYSASPAQVVLRWLTQKGWGVIPKSRNPQHIKENINLHFNLKKNDYDKISKLRDDSTIT